MTTSLRFSGIELSEAERAVIQAAFDKACTKQPEMPCSHRERFPDAYGPNKANGINAGIEPFVLWTIAPEGQAYPTVRNGLVHTTARQEVVDLRFLSDTEVSVSSRRIIGGNAVNEFGNGVA